MKSITFTAEMVHAILEGNKTQTRRPVKMPEGTDLAGRSLSVFIATSTERHQTSGGWVPKVQQYIKCPYGKPGDRLWVRETFWNANFYEHEGFSRLVQYAADGDPENTPNKHYPEGLIHGFSAPDPYCCWVKRPSIHMPRWASRLTLETTEVRVERVQDISIRDALDEGIRCPDCGYTAKDAGTHMDHAVCVNKWLKESKVKDVGDHSAIGDFRALWGSIYGQKPDLNWNANPFVWVISFKVVP